MLIKCKYCGLSFDNLNNSQKANHSRWCELNPRSSYDRQRLRQSSSYARQIAISPEARSKAGISISKLHEQGRYKDAPSKATDTKRSRGNDKHSPESIEKIRQAALRSGHRRVCKKSHQFTDKQDRVFIFDSSWEDALAIRLDELNINWERPEPIKWIDKQGTQHNYFADFYLPDHNLYIDPKNQYVKEQQKEKLDILSNQINLLILSSLDECKLFTI